ncbi:hypothetical protein [Acrocarpospora catenulata]|uniref:hypothetical protein n=1 Tax=Acrocarpospora catenulata TaxID=2836182 RepID=UPI001BD9CE62|nr:hypothetical protein [Acrocarpospora catenulata]
MPVRSHYCSAVWYLAELLFRVGVGLAAGTVARAYKELERAGYVTGKRGGGTRVLPQPEPQTTQAELIEQHARAYLAEVARLDGTAEQAVAAVRTVIATVSTE